MAFPSIIRKIMDLRAGAYAGAVACVVLAEQNIRMANRLVAMDLAALGDGRVVRVEGRGMPPEGYTLGADLLVAPVTLASANGSRLPGAALTMVVADM